MPSERLDAIPGFSPVAPTIWEYIPTQSTTKEKSLLEDLEHPDLVLLFSWTGALGRHVQKYTDFYKTRFPSTPILVVTTSILDLCYRSSSLKQNRLQPAIHRVLFSNSDNILIHAFSEGGSNKAVEFAEAYYKTTGKRLPCSALCLDSTPGHARYRRLCNALKLSLPANPIIRCSGLVFGSILLGGILAVQGRKNNIVAKTRRRLADECIWDLSAPRCYLYSQSDALIAWQDVQEHAREMMEMGAPVVDVGFERSEHCKHVAEDTARYWDAVTLTWRKALMQEAYIRKIQQKWTEMQTFEFDIPGSDVDSERTLWVQEEDARYP